MLFKDIVDKVGDDDHNYDYNLPMVILSCILCHGICQTLHYDTITYVGYDCHKNI